MWLADVCGNRLSLVDVPPRTGRPDLNCDLMRLWREKVIMILWLAFEG